MLLLASALQAYAHVSRNMFMLSNLNADNGLSSPRVYSIVVGNSITDGRGSTTNHQNRWTDFLSDALNAVFPIVYKI